MKTIHPVWLPAFVHLSFFCAALSIQALAEPPTANVSTELLRDPQFQAGFELLRPEPGRKVDSGKVRGKSADEPVWQLAQWSSRHPLDQATPVAPAAAGGFRLSNSARSVSFGGDDGMLTLAVNAAAEYGDHPRAKTEPWVHLLVEQPIATTPRLVDLSELRLHLEARRVKAKLASDVGYDPAIHAAQFQLFLSIQNLEKGSPGFGNYLWFGIPIYDNRHRLHPTYAAPDFGGTGKFIYTAATKHFTTGSTHDDNWVTFDADLLPLIREGLTTAHARGFLKDSPNEGSFRVAALNMGWEVPGTFDVELQVRHLTLNATRR
jgi:hypothetical protein